LGHDERHDEESSDLLNIIEHEVLPTYYHRNVSGYSHPWVALSKASMKSTIPRFNAQRMVRDYVRDCYAPARDQRLKLEANHASLARELAAWKQRVRDAWPGVTMELQVQPSAHLFHDEQIMLRVQVRLNGLSADDVRLECLLGRASEKDEVQVEQTAQLSAMGEENGAIVFGIDLDPQLAGLQYYKLRMYPYNPAQSHPFEMGAMIWI
jgi:starch phosphorylase